MDFEGRMIIAERGIKAKDITKELINSLGGIDWWTERLWKGLEAYFVSS